MRNLVLMGFLVACGSENLGPPRGTGGTENTGGYVSSGGSGGEEPTGAFWKPCESATASGYDECPGMAEQMLLLLPVQPPICADELLRCTFHCDRVQSGRYVAQAYLEDFCSSLGGECTLIVSGRRTCGHL
jgi:hypothetical protein